MSLEELETGDEDPAQEPEIAQEPEAAHEPETASEPETAPETETAPQDEVTTDDGTALENGIAPDEDASPEPEAVHQEVVVTETAPESEAVHEEAAEEEEPAHETHVDFGERPTDEHDAAAYDVEPAHEEDAAVYEAHEETAAFEDDAALYEAGPAFERDANHEEEAPPRTRRCRVCSVEINAASARCPYCGTRQFKHQPLLGWRGLIILVVALAAAVLITRAIIDAENDALHYDSYDSVNLAAFVPAGWTNQLLSAPHGTAMAGYVDPASAADTLTVRASLDPSGSPHSRMLALYDKLASQPGVARGYHSSVTLPGDNLQWSDYYTLAGAFYAVFFSDVCNGKVGLTVTLSSSSATRLQQYALTLPWTTQPHCDGPAFSGRDRGDTSLPLAPR